MGNYKSRPVASCGESWKNRISENYALIRRRLHEDLSHADTCKPPRRVTGGGGGGGSDDAPVKPDIPHSELLNQAILESDSEKVSELIEANGDLVNCKLDTENFRPLHFAVISSSTPSQISRLSIIKLLISKGANIDATTRNGFTALHLSVFKVDAAATDVLLSSRPETVHTRGYDSLTSLHLACLQGSEEIINLLLDRGADVDALDAVKFSPLHVIVYSHNDKISLVKLLCSKGASLTHPSAMTPTTSAVSSSSLAGGTAAVPAAEYIHILHLASSRRQLETVKYLLECSNHVDVNAVDLEKNSALHLASKQGHLSVVKMLISQPSIAHCVNVYGDSPLHLACYSGKKEVAEVLLDRFGDSMLIHANVFGETPLHASCTNGENLELIKLLLMRNSSVINLQSSFTGHTPLHSASFHGHFEAAQLLVSNGADINLLANPGSEAVNDAEYQETCAQWAADNGFDDLAHWLNCCRSNGEGRSGYSSTEGSYVSIPSKIGKIKSVTQEKIGVLSLRAQLPKNLQIEYQNIEKLEHIGSGGFGRVFKARLRSTNEIVAVKIYRHHNHSSKTDIDMFVREVKILWQMNNPFIVKFHGVCLDDASNFSIITEFCANGSLYGFIHKQKRCLDLASKLVILQNVATGMNYLHTLPDPVIHRDLNSFNILLRDSMNAVVADFGESRFIGRLLRQEMLTKQPGNLRWMAPEVFNQSTEYNTKADVFNFSLCIWEILSSELPFSHLSPLEAAQEIARHQRPPIHPSFPEDLVALMCQCWDEVPNNRPDFAQILKTLDSVLLMNEISANMPQLSVSCNLDLTERLSVAELRSNFESSSSPNSDSWGKRDGGVPQGTVSDTPGAGDRMGSLQLCADGYVLDTSLPSRLPHSLSVDNP